MTIRNLENRIESLKSDYEKHFEQDIAVPRPIMKRENLVEYLITLPLPNSIFEIARDEQLSMAFLLRSDLLPREKHCRKCYIERQAVVPMKFMNNDRYVWVCNQC